MGTVKVTRCGPERFMVEFSALPHRTFGPWDFPTACRDLRVSALLTGLEARDLVMDAAVLGVAEREVNR